VRVGLLGLGVGPEAGGVAAIDGFDTGDLLCVIFSPAHVRSACLLQSA
jgi:hypothetical protein